MGVEYFACGLCDEIICDVGPYNSFLVILNDECELFEVCETCGEEVDGELLTDFNDFSFYSRSKDVIVKYDCWKDLCQVSGRCEYGFSYTDSNIRWFESLKSLEDFIRENYQTRLPTKEFIKRIKNKLDEDISQLKRRKRLYEAVRDLH
jgi:hypothetical protein